MTRTLLRLIIAGLLLSTSALAMAPAAGAAPTPPSNCTIVPETFADGNVGTLNTWFFSTTGCSTSKKPVQFKVVEGRIPPGTTLFTQGVGSGGITGEPTIEGVFAFTIQVRDATGTKDTESFSITINPPRPVLITNQSDALSPGTVGEFYCCGNLFADGGVAGIHMDAGLRRAATRAGARGEPGADHGHADDGRHVHLHSPGH